MADRHEVLSVVNAMFDCGPVMQEKLAKLLRAELQSFITKAPPTLKTPTIPFSPMSAENHECENAARAMHRFLMTPNHDSPVWRACMNREFITFVKQMRVVVTPNLGLRDAKVTAEQCFGQFLGR